MADWLDKVKARTAAAAPLVPPTPSIVSGRVALIDGDFLAYFAAGGDEMKPEVAKQVATERMTALKEISGAQQVELHLTARDSDKAGRFLLARMKPYQGQRNSGRKPKNWGVVREFLETADVRLLGATRYSWVDREADDAFAMRAYNSADPANLVVHHTADKDMRMLPGIHIAWRTFTETIVPAGAYDVVCEVSGDQFGHKWFWMQMLMGDTADNIPGIPKLGIKGAEKLLDGTTCNEEAYGIVRKRYMQEWPETKYADAAFVEMAALLWLRKTTLLWDFARILPLLGKQTLARAMREAARYVEEQREALDNMNEERPPWE